jgi:hypothetical protein
MTKMRAKAAMRKTQPIIGLKNQQATASISIQRTIARLPAVSSLFEYAFASSLMVFNSVKAMLTAALICSPSRAKLLLFAVVSCCELLCQRFNVKNAAKKLKLTTRVATAHTRITAMNQKTQNAAVNP